MDNKTQSGDNKPLSENKSSGNDNNCFDLKQVGLVDHIRHSAEIVYEEMKKKNFLWVYWNRIPNAKEVINTVSITSLIDVTAAPVFKSLGNHPSAKNILRDMAKIPSIMMNVHQNTSVGSTKYVYDEFHTAAAGTKVGCKVGVIFVAPKVIPFANLVPVDILARVSNGICEIPSSALLLAGKERQNEIMKNPSKMKDVTAMSYFVYNLDASWFYNGILNTIGKVTITDTIGTAANSIFSVKFAYQAKDYVLKGMSDTFKYWIYNLPGIKHIFNNLFKSDNLVIDVMTKAVKTGVATFPSMYQMIKNQDAVGYVDKAKLIMTAFFVDYTLKALSEVGVTLILTAPARVVVDSITYLYDVWNNEKKHRDHLKAQGIDICAIEKEHGRHHHDDHPASEVSGVNQPVHNDDL